MNKTKTIRIGSGAGYSGDRIEPAAELAKKGKINYLVFECLAERTIALAQKARKSDPEAGFDPLLEERLRACIPACRENNIKVITNMGAANPVSAMKKAAGVLKEEGIKDYKIAAVTGDDILGLIGELDAEFIETGESLENYRKQIISANAYLGAAPIVEALRGGADLIITGRVADPALFIAPLIHGFGWEMNNYSLLGQATVMGHLMECAAQVTGGYFADPGVKEVSGLDNLGFPIAELNSDGSFSISKLPDTGGIINAATCKEQLLYEIHDPARYLTPDVVADFSQVIIREAAKDFVEVHGGTGKKKTGMLKVSVGYLDGWIGEGQISYGGAGAVTRGQLALNIIKKRLINLNIDPENMDLSIIGVNSLYRDGKHRGAPAEVRVRVAARTPGYDEAVKIGNEVEALYTNGPAAGGGVSKHIREVVAIKSILIPESLVRPEIHYLTI